MASSLPRPAQQLLRRDAVERGEPLRELVRLRLGIAIEAGDASDRSRARHGNSLACRRSKAGSQLACEYGFSATISGRASARMLLMRAPPASASSRTRHGAAVRIEAFQPASVMAVGPSARRPSALSSCTVMRF